MSKYTLDDIINFTGEDIRKVGGKDGMSKKEFIKMARVASGMAKSRRTRSLNSIRENDLPLPTAFKEWFRQTNDKIDKTIKLQGITDKDYKIGYANVSFDIEKDMSLNQLKHQFRLARDFLRTKSSIIGGKAYKNPITGKKEYYVDEKGDFIKDDNGKPIEKQTGWLGHLRDVIVYTEKALGYKIDSSFYKEFWEIFNKIEKSREYEVVWGNSDDTRQELAYILSANRYSSTQEIIDNVKKRLEEKFTERQKQEQEIEDDQSRLEKEIYYGGSNY